MSPNPDAQRPANSMFMSRMLFAWMFGQRNDRSEDKIDAIQEQLAVIQQALKEVNPSASPATVHPVPRPVPSADSVPPFEGQSSFHHESILAKDAAFSAVAGAQGKRLDDHVSAALSSLTHSLDRNTSLSRDHTSSSKTSASPVPKEELLPVDLAVSVIKAVKGIAVFLRCDLC